MIHPIHVGRTIHRLRQKAGISQTELADRLFVTHQAVSRWETGQSMPSIDAMVALKKLFDIPLDILFAEKDVFTKTQALTQLDGENRQCVLYAIVDGQADKLSIEDVIHRLDERERMIMLRRLLRKKTFCDFDSLFPRLLYAERRYFIEYFNKTGYPAQTPGLKDLMSRRERELLRRKNV